MFLLRHGGSVEAVEDVGVFGVCYVQVTLETAYGNFLLQWKSLKSVKLYAALFGHTPIFRRHAMHFTFGIGGGNRLATNKTVFL